MKNLKKFIFVFIILCLTAGCGSKSSSEEQLPQVTDDAITNVIKGHVIDLESVPATIDLYKKGKFTADDYKLTDKIQYGLNSSFGLETNIDLSAQEIANLKARNINNVTSYIEVSEVENAIDSTFGSIDIKHEGEVGTCPKYTYDSTDKRYYVNESCTLDQKSIISYVSSINYEGNLYYATVYVGFIENNKVYNNVKKSKVIKELASEESYAIDEENKDDFEKYTYTFTKNSDGNYIFTKVEK